MKGRKRFKGSGFAGLRGSWRDSTEEVSPKLDAMDRALDFALEELERERSHGGSRGVAPDLVGRVRQAWDRGQRGHDLSDLDASPRADREQTQPPGPRPSASSPSPRRAGGQAQQPRWSPWRRSAAIAAAMLVFVGCLWIWQATRSDHPLGAGGVAGPTVADGPKTGDREDALDPANPGHAPDPLAMEDPNPVDPGLRVAQLAPELRQPLRDSLGFLLEAPLVTRGLAAEAERAGNDRRELLAALAEDELAWTFIAQELERELAAGAPTPMAGPRLVALMLEAPKRFGSPLARMLWLVAPASFGPLDLVAFAERDLFEFKRELVALALERDPEFLADAGGPDVIAAAWLVNRGDPRGLATLDLALGSIPLEIKDPLIIDRLRGLAVAGSLLQASQGGDAWSRGYARYFDIVQGFKAADDLEAASTAVTLLEFAHDAPAPPDFPITSLAQAIAVRYDEQEWRSADWEALDERMLGVAEWRDR